MTPLAAWVCVVALGSVMGVSAVDEPYMLPVLLSSVPPLSEISELDADCFCGSRTPSIVHGTD